MGDGVTSVTDEQTDRNWKIEQKLGHCCTRLSVGIMLQGGTGWRPPIRGSVFFEQLPRSYLADVGQFFHQKAHAIYIDDGGKDKKINPSNQMVPVSRTKGPFPKLRGSPCVFD